MTAPPGFGAQLDAWLRSEADKAVGGLLDLFGEKAFAILFALPGRWRRIDIGGPGRRRQIERLKQMAQRLERFSRPRFAFFFGRRRRAAGGAARRRRRRPGRAPDRAARPS